MSARRCRRGRSIDVDDIGFEGNGRVPAERRYCGIGSFFVILQAKHTYYYCHYKEKLYGYTVQKKKEENPWS
jgi:hypothetical protein